MTSSPMICTICARGGSKGVPGKNIKDLNGKPVLAWTILQARASGLFAAIAVSSDSDAILDVAGEYGADFLVQRPAEMATDEAGKVGAIRHCLLAAEERFGQRVEVFVDLDATSPLRFVEDIVGSVALLRDTGAPNVITGCTARRSPYFNLVECDAAGHVHLAIPPAEEVLRRQDAPACFDMNGSVYVWRRDHFVESPSVFYDDTRLYEMPEDRSIDIDTPVDFELVKLLQARQIADGLTV